MTLHKVLTINIDYISLRGDLNIPENPLGLVIFSHGSGSGRFSPRNNFVAQQLQQRGLATFLFDLLTKEEDEFYWNRFDIELLSDRLVEVTQWLLRNPLVNFLPMAYFGASTGAASALSAAAELKDDIYAVVSRGGRPDLAKEKLSSVKCPTLLLVGDRDTDVLRLNKQALEKLSGIKSLTPIPSATHLFEEPGTLEEVARLSADWFVQHLPHSENKLRKRESKYSSAS
jgi:putative phosphoribosyl transferase